MRILPINQKITVRKKKPSMILNMPANEADLPYDLLNLSSPIPDIISITPKVMDLSEIQKLKKAFLCI